MTLRSQVLVASASLAAGLQAADAGLVSTNSQTLWNNRVSNAGLVVQAQDFAGLDGSYARLAGVTGGVAWSTTAVEVSAGVARSASSNSVTFTFAPGVKFVGGNFFGVAADFTVVPVVFSVSLNGGGGYTGLAVGPSGFTGFSATGASTISSLTVTVNSASAYSAIDSMYFGVPAPGAIALIGAAAMIATNARRR
jgi:hypothetical protein